MVAPLVYFPPVSFEIRFFVHLPGLGHEFAPSVRGQAEASDVDGIDCLSEPWRVKRRFQWLVLAFLRFIPFRQGLPTPAM